MNGVSHFDRYVLINTATGTQQPLINSPNSYGGEALWLPNSQSIILSDVFLPLNGIVGTELKARELKPFTLELQVPTGNIAAIGEANLHATGWDTELGVLECQEDLAAGDSNSKRPPSPRVFLHKVGGLWVRVKTIPAKYRVQILLIEDMNSPPKIYAIDELSGIKSLVLDLNPQFAKLWFGRVEQIHWRWTKGKDWAGGLYYPPDYVPGRRYPLVIQTHAWDPSKFWIDGPWTTAFAAQPMAAHDIVVLQVSEGSYNVDEKEQVRTATRIYESAIDELDRRGLIDRSNVGIIGFSHTCFFVKYVLTHSSYNFAAASVSEGEDGGYLQYITNGNWFVDADHLYGGPPFGAKLEQWIKLSPGFNLDRVHATPHSDTKPKVDTGGLGMVLWIVNSWEARRHGHVERRGTRPSEAVGTLDITAGECRLVSVLASRVRRPRSN